MKITDFSNSKVCLAGIYLLPDGTWVVTDGRKALKNEFSCDSKGAVLSKIAEILEDMSPPEPLSVDIDPAEVTVLVTLQPSLCDFNSPVAVSDLRRAVKDAIKEAVKQGEDSGFIHSLADDVSIGVVSVDTLTME